MPLPRARSAFYDDGPALFELTRAPLLSGEEEVRVALDIDAARRRLFEALRRCPEAVDALLRRTGGDAATLASLDPRTLDLASAVEQVRDPAARERLDVLQGDLARAVGRLALHNTRLAVSIARRYVNRGLPLPDLIQEAFLGLLKAARRFEPRRGLKFSTSATWWIRQAVVLALQERGRLVRVPARALEALGRVRRARSALEQALGREPSIDELAGESRIPRRKARALVALLGAPRSLDARPEDGAALADVLPHAEAPEPGRLREDLQRAMEPLSEREREIVVRRFGLGGRDPDTLEQIGRGLGVTRERIRQLEKAVMAKLRGRLGRLGYELQPRSAAPAP